jgi:acetyltransferase-like isoleucine patch superfamily enzyme
MFRRLILKIRRANTPFTRKLKAAVKFFLYSSLPTPRFLSPALGFIYRAGFAFGSILDHAISFFVRAPLFRARCTECGKNFSVHHMPRAVDHTKIYIGDDVHFHGKVDILSLRLFDEPRLVLGNRVNIGHMVNFLVSREITMGDDSGISNGCIIADNDGHPRDAAKRAQGSEPDGDEIRPVHIGARAWIASGSFIGKGVTIGEGAIVAANSTVLTDVPPYTVVMGNPARVVVRNLNPQDAEPPKQTLVSQTESRS